MGIELDWKNTLSDEVKPSLVRAYASKDDDALQLAQFMIDREIGRHIECDDDDEDDEKKDDGDAKQTVDKTMSEMKISTATKSELSLSTVSPQQLCDIQRAKRLFDDVASADDTGLAKHLVVHPGPWHKWVSNIPSREVDYLSPANWQSAMRRRLRLPVATTEAKCRHCRGGRDDRLGDHALQCAGSGYLTHRHNAVRDLMFEFAKESGYVVQKEQNCGAPGKMAPADVLVVNFDVDTGKHLAIDVAVINPFTDDRDKFILDEATAGATATVYEDRHKRAKYKGKLDETMYIFAPCVMESTGGVSKTMHWILQRFARAQYESSMYWQSLGSDEDQTISKIYNKMLMRLSIALQTQNGRSILAHIPLHFLKKHDDDVTLIKEARIAIRMAQRKAREAIEERKQKRSDKKEAPVDGTKLTTHSIVKDGMERAKAQRDERRKAKAKERKKKKKKAKLDLSRQAPITPVEKVATAVTEQHSDTPAPPVDSKVTTSSADEIFKQMSTSSLVSQQPATLITPIQCGTVKPIMKSTTSLKKKVDLAKSKKLKKLLDLTIRSKNTTTSRVSRDTRRLS